jgi:hypothetical protein
VHENGSKVNNRFEKSTQMPESQEPTAPKPMEVLAPSRAVTAASEWKKVREEGFVVDLPSGKTARLKRTLSLINAMENGNVPNPLAKVVQELLEGKRTVINTNEMEEDEKIAFMNLITSEVPLIFVYPKVLMVPPGENAATWDPEDPDSISIADVSWEDRSFAYSFAQGGPASLELFRKAEKAVAAMANERAVQNAAESVAGN